MKETLLNTKTSGFREKMENESWKRYQMETTNNLYLYFIPEYNQLFIDTDLYESIFYDPNYSNIRNSQTLKQFCEKLFEVTSSLGISLDDLVEKFSIRDNEDNDKYISETMIKIYNAMIAIGYNHFDLTV